MRRWRKMTCKVPMIAERRQSRACPACQDSSGDHLMKEDSPSPAGHGRLEDAGRSHGIARTSVCQNVKNKMTDAGVEPAIS